MVVWLSTALRDSKGDVKEEGGKAAERSGKDAETKSSAAEGHFKNKLHLKTFFKEESKLSEEKTKGTGLTIAAEGKEDGVHLEELQKQALIQRTVSDVYIRQWKFKQAWNDLKICIMILISEKSIHWCPSKFRSNEFDLIFLPKVSVPFACRLRVRRNTPPSITWCQRQWPRVCWRLF